MSEPFLDCVIVMCCVEALHIMEMNQYCIRNDFQGHAPCAMYVADGALFQQPEKKSKGNP
jgi:hypothetical protein